MSDITRRGATGVGVASVVAAGSGYVVLLIAAKVLDKAENADFLAFWGLLFFLFGVLAGLQSEITRSVHVERTSESARTTTEPAGARVLPVGLGIGAVLAVAIVGTSPLWAGAVLGPDSTGLVALTAAAVLAFAGHSTVAGTLAGAGHWTTYARLVGAESLVRLVLVAAVVLAASEALELPTAAAAGTWLLFLLVARVRAVRHQRADVAPRALLTGAGHAMVGTASSAALVVGFPVLLRVTTPTEVYALAAPLLLAVQLTRAPLLIPLNAYQGVAITHFLAHREQGTRPLLRLAAVIGAVGVVGALAASAVGPWLMEVLLGPGYRVAPLVLGGLTVTAALLALLTLTGAATLALGGHRAYAAGWLVATACSAAVLLLPGDLEARVVSSLALGPMVGVAVHASWVRRVVRVRR